MLVSLTAQVSGSPMTIPDALITAIMGYAIVFLGIFLLIVIVSLVNKAMVAMNRKNEAPIPVADKTAPVVPLKKTGPLAPGAAGELKLYDTDPKTAAMIMAIVADKMGKPLNELRFISIKEVK